MPREVEETNIPESYMTICPLCGQNGQHVLYIGQLVPRRHTDIFRCPNPQCGACFSLGGQLWGDYNEFVLWMLNEMRRVA